MELSRRKCNVAAAVSEANASRVVAAEWCVVNAAGEEEAAAALIEEFGASVLLHYLPELLLRQRVLRDDPAGQRSALWNHSRRRWSAALD